MRASTILRHCVPGCLLLCLVACGGTATETAGIAAPTAPASLETPEVLPTPNSVVLAMTADAAAAASNTPTPTSTPSPATCADVDEVCLQITFDGHCVYEGPANVTAGKTVLLFVNESDSVWGLDIARHLTSNTLEDMADYFRIHHRLPWPYWARDQYNVRRPVEPDESLAWERDLVSGTHSVVCVSDQVGVVIVGGGFVVDEP